MTIAAGFLCSDGFVLAADTLHSGINKRYAAKIWKAERGDVLVAVAGSGDAPCPDCEDNGLNGPQQPEQQFPTGHMHPPAHPGCRCLLTRSAT